MGSSTSLSQRTARKLLGWGVKTAPTALGVEQAQDVVFENGDLAVVSGLDAIGQDLKAAFTTALGADPLNVNFGFDGFSVIANETDKFLLKEKLRISVINLLRHDPRISKIDQVLIGEEVQEAGINTDKDDYGVLGIHVVFRLNGNSERINIKIGSIFGVTS